MFPRGPRFEVLKIPDVPGPNSYDLTQESQLDAYKRGAFLEKTDRFPKENDSEFPGSGTYNSIELEKAPTKPSITSLRPVGQPPNLVDRYAVLHRKVEDLERAHAEGKKTHQAEVGRLKLELTRSQKSNAELSERYDKQKRQIETLETRIQDSKKAASVDQAEIKELRVKLRLSEHERTQTSTKLGELGDLKKALQSSESKRKDDIREKERKIIELEKSLAGEKKARESTETKLQDIKGKYNEEVQAAHAAAQNSESLIAKAKDEARHTRSILVSLQADNRNTEELLAQLGRYRQLLGQAAEEYGRLVSKTTPIATHTRLQREHVALQIRSLRTERKLANAEGQVVELASLIRQTKEQNQLLSRWLVDASQEISFYVQALHEAATMPNGEADAALRDIMDVIQGDILESRDHLQNIQRRDTNLAAKFYRLAYEEVLLVYSLADKDLCDERVTVKRHATDLASALTAQKVLVAQMNVAEKERITREEQLKVATELVDELKITAQALKCQVAETEEKMQQGVLVNEAALKKEKETVRRLTTTFQKNRMAEDVLRTEIEQLTGELMDAERYQGAYYSLLDEVGATIARNELAESEAERLGKLNAEILGHNNPAQRIVYVDRIRKEMAETKHKLAMLTREYETVVGQNDDLRHELDMYKSVMVPVAHKSRTNITHIARLPLKNLTPSTNTADVKPQQPPVLETVSEDMTLDEVL